MKCYKCKAQNNSASIKCSNCGTLIKFVCPKCKKIHPLKTLECTCSYVFLRKCPKCDALNKNKNEICRKCGISFIEDSKLLAKIEIELFEFEKIEEKLKKSDASNKVLKFFYQIAAKNAKKIEAKAKKKSTYVLEISKKVSKNKITDIIECANSIENDINSFNKGLFAKIKLVLDVSIKVFEDQIEVYTAKTVVIQNENVADNDLTEEILPDEAKNEIQEEKESEIEIEKESLKKHLTESTEETKIETQDKKEPKELSAVAVETLEKEPQEDLQELITREKLYHLFNKNIKEDSSNFCMTLSCEISENPLILMNNYVTSISQTKFIYLLGNCSDFTKNTPFGLFNDVFKSLLGLSFFNIDEPETKAGITKFLKDNFAIEDNVVEFFIDFILPNQDSNIYNIKTNQKKVYEAFEILFSVLLENSKIIFAINDAQYLDKDSYELLVHLFNKCKFNSDLNIVIFKDAKVEIKTQIDFENLRFKNHIEYALSPMGEEETKEYLLMLSGGNVVLPIALEKEIVYKSKGRSSFLEEAFGWLIQNSALVLEEKGFRYKGNQLEIPEDYEKLVNARINNLFQKSQDVYNCLVLSSLMGPKFNPFILNAVLQFEEEKFGEIINMLVSTGILIPFDNFNLVFKNKTIYKTIQESLNIGAKGNYIKAIIDAFAKYTLTDSSVYFKLCNDANIDESILENYTAAEKELASKGSVHLLLNVYQNLIDVVSSSEIENKKELKYEFIQKAGIVSYQDNPNLAIEYLPKIVNSYEENEEFIDALDVSGYLTKSAMLQGDFNLAIECLNKALHYIDENDEKIIEKAFLKYIKLKPLFELGYYQEVINTAKNDVLPVLKTVLSRKEESFITVEKLKEIILEAEFFIAKSLTLQVHKDALLKLGEVDNKAKKEGNTRILCEQNLYLALYYVLTGACIKAKNILIDLQGAVTSGQLDMKNIVLWRFTTLLNNLFTGEKSAIKNEIENISIVANDLNMHFIEHSLNLINAKIEGSNDIVYEELTYFAENKIATGALFCWYFMAKQELEKDPKKAFSIAEQALDVTQKPEINNIYFEILFNKIIAESYIINGDLDLAQLHIEKAYKQAKDNQIFALEATMYVISAKLFQEKASNNIDTINSADSANKLYIKAIELANEIKNEHILTKTQKDLKDFMTFCQLSQIEF